VSLKQIVVLAGVILILILGLRGFSNVRTDALVAEERVRVLEEERTELEHQMEEAAEGYKVLRDSLDQAHDSLSSVRAEAILRVSVASRSFNEGIGVLRDSLQTYGGLGDMLDQIQVDHEEEVVAYQVQIQTLEDDKVLLWGRVTVLDSLWIQEQELNMALRNEITALNQEADAWQRAANPNIFKRLGGSIPYILVGAGAIVLLN
jgi:chromosome segregation ATPase